MQDFRPHLPIKNTANQDVRDRFIHLILYILLPYNLIINLLILYILLPSHVPSMALASSVLSLRRRRYVCRPFCRCAAGPPSAPVERKVSLTPYHVSGRKTPCTHHAHTPSLPTCCQASSLHPAW
ncbi:hypothetical protein BRADI_1g42375v3 [Brachypodium distachyon]|uniref:Uncharacterized protein n=1 Tax=Brachypodium distachyon TaxID=15368 RepID=A0A2K2DNV7_BRADI|nr:hypothetical protein BRADI_1g42375v3 [Brachypodium distachyon]